jgi:hypothetical protein
MENESFTTSYWVEQAPEAVFAAVNDVRAWWSGDIEGRTDVLGAEFTYAYQTFHQSTQKITEFVPGRKVVWRISESHLGFVEDEAEWNGTEVTFAIRRHGDKTELRFTHVGLIPALECFDKCARAWGFYIDESLRSLITTGKGVPNPG